MTPIPVNPRISSADQDQNHQIDALRRAEVIASLHSHARAATGHDLNG
ncbi:hypothetical protein [Rhodococcus jostii]